MRGKKKKGKTKNRGVNEYSAWLHFEREEKTLEHHYTLGQDETNNSLPI